MPDNNKQIARVIQLAIEETTVKFIKEIIYIYLKTPC